MKTIEVSRDLAIISRTLHDTLRYPTQSAIDDALAALGRVALKRLQMIEDAPCWTPVATLPDAAITVMIYCAWSNEPVWPGYFAGSKWFHIEGGHADPTHWMPLPMGPTS